MQSPEDTGSLTCDDPFRFSQGFEGALLPAPFQTILHNGVKQKVNFYFHGGHKTQAWCHVVSSEPSVIKAVPRTAQLLSPWYRMGSRGLGGSRCSDKMFRNKFGVSAERQEGNHKAKLSGQRPGEPAGLSHIPPPNTYLPPQNIIGSPTLGVGGLPASRLRGGVQLPSSCQK